MITESEYKEACAVKDKAEKILNAYRLQKINDFEKRWQQFNVEKKFFADSDLVYASHARCKKCNAGLAYPSNCGPAHQWTCSNVLKGIGTDNGHDAFPFMFYEIKSEKQPSAQGATTRPNPETKTL